MHFPIGREQVLFFLQTFFFFGMYPSPAQSFDIDLVVPWSGDISWPPVTSLSKREFCCPRWVASPGAAPRLMRTLTVGNPAACFLLNLLKTFSSDLCGASTILSKILDDDAISTHTQSGPFFFFYWPSCYVTNHSLCSCDDRWWLQRLPLKLTKDDASERGHLENGCNSRKNSTRTGCEKNIKGH